LAFTRIHGTWVSEDLEPVAVRFAWERRTAAHPFSDSDCICSKELAAQLIQSLFSGSEPFSALAVGPDTLVAARPREVRAN
jgi:hypothetical protein